MTERELLDLLHQRHSQRSQGKSRRYVVVEHVRDDAGFSATRTLDAVVMDTWPSAGLALHGYEVKTTRGDYLRELAQPHKSDPWRDLLDTLSFVTAPGVVKDDLPDGWGHLEAQGTRLVARTRPTELRPIVRGLWAPDRPQVPRGLVAALLRATCRT